MKLNTIGADELKKGITYILENAEEMISEGDLLFNNNRFARAYTLYQLASEEVGKSHLLFKLLLDIKTGEAPDYNEVNKHFREHKEKSRSAIYFEKAALLLMYGNKEGDKEERRNDFSSEIQALDKEAENVNELNDNKNNSLYVGIKDDKFLKPIDMITKEMAESLRDNTIIRLKVAQPLLGDFIRDIDILAKGVKQFQDSGKEIDQDMLDSFFKG